MSVYTKLMQARIRLQAQDVRKSGENKFAGYKYMELGDFLPPTQAIFAELGLCGLVSFTADLASLTIIDTEDLSQHVITSPMGSAALKGCHEVQNIGAVETYQRRYLWVTAMEIVEHDALDSAEPIKPAPKTVNGPADTFKDNPKKDAFDGLQPEVQDFLRRVSRQVAEAIPDVPKAIEIAGIAVEEWPDEDPHAMKMGLWHLLDSKTRSAIDAVQKAKR